MFYILLIFVFKIYKFIDLMNLKGLSNEIIHLWNIWKFIWIYWPGLIFIFYLSEDILRIKFADVFSTFSCLIIHGYITHITFIYLFLYLSILHSSILSSYSNQFELGLIDSAFPLSTLLKDQWMIKI